jgi:hypothetical protein
MYPSYTLYEECKCWIAVRGVHVVGFWALAKTTVRVLIALGWKTSLRDENVASQSY